MSELSVHELHGLIALNHCCGCEHHFQYHFVRDQMKWCPKNMKKIIRKLRKLGFISIRTYWADEYYLCGCGFFIERDVENYLEHIKRTNYVLYAQALDRFNDYVKFRSRSWFELYTG